MLATRKRLPAVLPILGGAAAADEALIGRLADAGARWVQLRDKASDDRRFYARARAMHAACERHGLYLIINDRVAVAAALGECGVHLGQADLPVVAARRLLPDAVIGLSCDRLADLATPDATAADYLAVGPVHATGSKLDAGDPIGLEGVRAARVATTRPLVAIGGIDAARAAAVTAAGADAVAVLSAVTEAPDPAAVCRALLSAARRGLEERLTPPRRPA